MNLARLGEDNVRTFGEYPALVFEGRELGRLATFKCPRQVRFVDSRPKSPVGKIFRKELRAQAR